MQLFHIPQCTIQNRNVHISVLNGTLWDTDQVHCGICEIGLLQLKQNAFSKDLDYKLTNLDHVMATWYNDTCLYWRK